MPSKDKHWLFRRLNLENVSEAFQKYVELRFELFQLETREQVLKIVSGLIVMLLIGSAAVLVLFFGSLTAAFYLNSVFGSSFIGFFLVAAFYLLLITFLIVFRKILARRSGILAFLEKYLISDDDGEDKE
jgi:hypothetical protein